PHTWRSWAGSMAVRSWPAKRTVPLRMTSRRGRRPMIERASTVLPDPDSPTIPSVLPRATVKETPSTARTVPRPVRNEVCRSSTSSRGPSSAPTSGNSSVWAPCPGPARLTTDASQQALAYVEPLAEAVADEVDGQQEEEHGGHGPDHDVGVGLEIAVGGTLGDHVPPGGGGKWHRQPEEGQRPLDDDDPGHRDQP